MKRLRGVASELEAPLSEWTVIIAPIRCKNKLRVGMEQSMNTEQLEVFVHADGVKPKVVTGEAAELLCDVLNRARIGSVGDADIFVFVGECDEALREPDEIGDGSDQHAPADVKKSLHELDLLRHRHVHVHRCRHIGVEVNFMSKDKRHRFSPATTVGVGVWVSVEGGGLVGTLPVASCFKYMAAMNA